MATFSTCEDAKSCPDFCGGVQVSIWVLGQSKVGGGWCNNVANPLGTLPCYSHFQKRVHTLSMRADLVIDWILLVSR
jgi:hypothetical protein